MRFSTIALSIVGFLLFARLLAADPMREVSGIADKISNPNIHLEEVGPLVYMGNTPYQSANIVLLPEVHDDPTSLLTQLLLIAREKKKDQPFIVLDESLGSMQKSMWDVFSQKSLEIVVAKDKRLAKEVYVPQRFETALQALANKFKASPGQLTYLQESGIWTLADFSEDAMPFYGWDTGTKSSLTDRNVQMVASLKTALKNHDRILVMLGARHVPELEFMTSQRLLCEGGRFNEMGKYFSAIDRKFGERPILRYGIGATSPLYSFLSKQKYAIVFNKGLYQELEHVVDQFRGNKDRNECFRITQ